MRENADQNNSKYGHFSRSAMYELKSPTKIKFPYFDESELYRGYKRNSHVIEYCYVFGCQNNSKVFFKKKKKKISSMQKL